MRIIFLDESGYAEGDWRSEKNLAEQPFHILAGVAFQDDSLPAVYSFIRNQIGELNIDGIDAEKLGKGLEIKARDVARGRGYWLSHEAERNSVRNIFLSSVREFGGDAFLVVIGKRAHHERYGNPDNPMLLASEFMYERFERYLLEKDDYGICIHDQNKASEDDVRGRLTSLSAYGSYVISSKALAMKHLEFKRVLENVMGDSESSIGLQIADFFATQTNTYMKDGRPAESGWWNLIYESLKTGDGGKVDGYGYKEFP